MALKLPFEIIPDLNEWFEGNHTMIILLLNKKDVFADKIKNVPIQICPSFSDYNGSSDSFEESSKYIRDAFLSLNRTKKQICTESLC